MHTWRTVTTGTGRTGPRGGRGEPRQLRPARRSRVWDSVSPLVGRGGGSNDGSNAAGSGRFDRHKAPAHGSGACPAFGTDHVMAAWSVGAGRASSRALLACAGRAMSLALLAKLWTEWAVDDTRGDYDRSDAIALQLHEQADEPLVRFTGGGVARHQPLAPGAGDRAPAPCSTTPRGCPPVRQRRPCRWGSTSR